MWVAGRVGGRAGLGRVGVRVEQASLSRRCHGELGPWKAWGDRDGAGGAEHVTGVVMW